jgi:hypothetical protein
MLPISEAVGLNPEIVGVTVNDVELLTVTPASITRIFPVLAAAGTEVVILTTPAEPIVAAVPLNDTDVTWAGINPASVIVTGVPAGPDDGEKEIESDAVHAKVARTVSASTHIRRAHCKRVLMRKFLLELEKLGYQNIWLDSAKIF